ncbi:MAG: DUF1643 domain-containing protein [Desulfovibrio sp.]|uniref:DUF1643 domain-containing protein n=1 Tax=Desulfovibrio sp. TaxID=885 RepID=UPI00135E16E4|nr:DUF1643 domain-containing protein [Desulfovibrio sp.]MTJ93912.1 DUF1643 domain-containing protein [Desulfovibrio sp.]
MGKDQQNFDLFGSAGAHDPGGKTRLRWPAGSLVTSRFSDCGLYRYELSEIWDPRKPLIMWLLMNPSVADTQFRDPTLAKTGKYSFAWGYGGQLIGNVHAYRATNSRQLLSVEDPIGPENDSALDTMASRASIVVLAYGKPPNVALRARGPAVAARLQANGAKLFVLGVSDDGAPKHPLYLADSLQPLPWTVAA